jgi:hypothetical protein
MTDFYLWVLHPVAYLSNWFFMTSIATKFQYINSTLIFFFTHYMFRPLQTRYTIRYLKDYFNTTDPLHVRNLK